MSESEVLGLAKQEQETQARKVQDNSLAALSKSKLFKKNFLDEDFSKDFNAEYEKTRRELEEAQKRFDVRHEQNIKALEDLEHELKGLQ